jgi:hypothetical protein
MTVAVQPFNPLIVYNVAGTNASVAQAITQQTGASSANGKYILRIYNPTGSVGSVSWAPQTNGTATATLNGAGSVPLKPNDFTTYDMGNAVSSIAVILGTATAVTVPIMIGEGGF